MITERMIQKYHRVFEKYFSIPAVYFDGLFYTIFSNERLYQYHNEPKRNGGYRKISAPCEALKLIQKKLHNYFSAIEIDKNLFAYRPGGSPVDNARFHIINGEIPKWMLKIDLKNAFPSVTRNTLLTTLSQIFFNHHDLKVSLFQIKDDKFSFMEFMEIIIWLTTHNNRMTQGAPSSPDLLNLSLVHLGIIETLKQLCHDYGINFSVYSDDFVFTSPNIIPNEFIMHVTRIIEDSEHFKVNPKKTKLTSLNYKAHRITGVVLTVDSNNQARLTLSQKTVKTYRGKFNRALKILSEGRMPDKEEDGMTINQILGHVTWVRNVCGNTLPSSIKKLVIELESKFKTITV